MNEYLISGYEEKQNWILERLKRQKHFLLQERQRITLQPHIGNTEKEILDKVQYLIGFNITRQFLKNITNTAGGYNFVVIKDQ